VFKPVVEHLEAAIYVSRYFSVSKEHGVLPSIANVTFGVYEPLLVAWDFFVGA